MKGFRLFALSSLLTASLAALACRSHPSSASAVGATSQPRNAAQIVEVVRVLAQQVGTTRTLPGELYPYETVAIYPKVTGFLSWIVVDRGSWVRKGELIARLEAPELVAQRAEADSRLQSAQSQRAAAEAKLAADQSTYEKLQKAAETPGVVAGNDLVQAQKTAQADQDQVAAQAHNVAAAEDALRAISQLEAYLKIYAPFDGVVTERDVHPGALVGPPGGSGGAAPIVYIQTLNRLRLAVPVPQVYVAGIREGTQVDFTVPAYPGVIFHAPLTRISHAVDIKTRTMPVELDVRNPDHRLEPGSFTQVLWPIRRPYPTLFVPASAVTTNLQRTFVIRVRDGKTEWIDVTTGATQANLVEVFGNLQAGDEVVVRATDELQAGAAVAARLAASM